jgi:hypothetical protein
VLCLVVSNKASLATTTTAAAAAVLAPGLQLLLLLVLVAASALYTRLSGSVRNLCKLRQSDVSKHPNIMP